MCDVGFFDASCCLRDDRVNRDVIRDEMPKSVDEQVSDPLSPTDFFWFLSLYRFKESVAHG